MKTHRSSNLPTSVHCGAGNIARSRLSGGPPPVCAGPQKLLSRGSQACLHRILLNIIESPIKLRSGSDQTIVAFFLPKWPVGTEEKIGLVASESFQRSQPFGGNHMRGGKKMNMIRHHDKGMEFIAMQYTVTMPQCRHHQLRNFRPPQKRRAISACIHQPVDGDKRPARRDESNRWEYPVRGKTAMQSEGDKQGFFHYVPMWQPPFIMPHTPRWCVGDRETLTASSRLKAGCGQDCPPSNLCLEVAGVA
jgi:hypothetical protein